MSVTPSETFAAVDLGSNSFHMIVANYSDQRLQVIDRMKEMVQLAAGLGADQRLDADSLRRAVECLERFGQRIRELPSRNVRAVGTNTLRQARNGRDFLNRARKALGHPIEVIAGREEARLIFNGVANSMYSRDEKRLVVDIGGGSTELIIGRGFDTYFLESLYMGCVNVSQQFFADGEISNKRMRKAVLFARQELEGIESTCRKMGWDAAVGCSGTIQTIGEVIRTQGWDNGAPGIGAEGLGKLREHLAAAGNSAALTLEGLSERRRPVFAGGVAVLSAVFEALPIGTMSVSDGALREGLLYDLIGRTHDHDIRERSVADLCQRYGVDQEQAARVAETALALFGQVAEGWGLGADRDRKLLGWAARLHEVGLGIAHAQHHRHAAYLLTHADLPGFSRHEQFNLAMLVRGHRRKPPLEEFAAIAEEDRAHLLRLCALLRIAVLVNRGRSYTAPPDIRATAADDRLELCFPRNWLAERPLSAADLEQEREQLEAIGFRLEYQ